MHSIFLELEGMKNFDLESRIFGVNLYSVEFYELRELKKEKQVTIFFSGNKFRLTTESSALFLKVLESDRFVYFRKLNPDTFLQ